MPHINGVWRPVLSLPFTTPIAQPNIMGRSCLLLGYSLIELSGSAPAQIDILDGGSANSTLVSPVSLDPGQSRLDWFGGEGIFCQGGPFLLLNLGNVRGALYYVDASSADLSAPGGDPQ